jgi:hypothetical protein
MKRNKSGIQQIKVGNLRLILKLREKHIFQRVLVQVQAIIIMFKIVFKKRIKIRLMN